MPIGVEHYTTDELTMLQRETLYRAARQIVERYMDDLEQLARRGAAFRRNVNGGRSATQAPAALRR
jgi:hypothetical protein